MQDTNKEKSKYSITPGEYAANVRKEGGYSDIREAIEYGDIDAVKQFIKEGADIHTLSAFFMAKSHNGKMLQFLIEQGLDIFKDNECMDFLMRWYYNDVHSYKEGGQPNNGGDRFSSERDIHNKYLGIIKVMVEHGYDVNKPLVAYWPPLQCALIYFVIPELVFYLVEECGADVNYAKYNDIEEEYKKYADNADEYGYDHVSIDEFKECRPESPLMHACRCDPGEETFEICKLLVRHGADVNYISHMYYFDDELAESSPLCEAIGYKNIHVVQLLIESGADVNLTMHGTELDDDSDERSPLLVALHEKNIPIIKLLLENGAKVTDSIREYVDEWCDFDDEIRELLGM